MHVPASHFETPKAALAELAIIENWTRPEVDGALDFFIEGGRHPVVENALKHGINPMIEGGFIRVSAARSGATLILKVADSGHGITDQQSYGSGTGLANVRMRLKMRYGEAAALSLAQAEPRGVVAAISLPIEAGS